MSMLPLVLGPSPCARGDFDFRLFNARRLPVPAALATLVRATGLRWILLHRGHGPDAIARGLAALAEVRAP